MELEKLSALEIGNLVNKRKISPVEVINYFIKRIEERDPSLNSFTYTKFDDALNEAKLLEKKIMSGEYGGMFAGVPIGLKDFLDSKVGWTNSHGGVEALIREDTMDSEFYRAAKMMGAIAVGKTNAPAFGFSGACQNKLYGATRNPFDISRTSGGSSGGSAAAVADGLLTLAEGGDAGGSIRIPANWCNLFGLKPSLGSVPNVCRPDAWSATHPYCFNGALTKTVADSAAILTVMSHRDRRDPMNVPINSRKKFMNLMKKPVKGKKVGFTYDFNLYPEVDPEIEDIVGSAVEQLQDAGVIVEEVNFNWQHSLEEMMKCWAISISVDTALDLAQWKSEGLDLVKDYGDQLPEEFIYYNERAAKMNIFDFRKFNEIRTDILDNFESVLVDYDYIISPVTVCKPMKIEDEGRCIEVNGVKQDPSINFISFGQTPLVNFIGYPAASVPAGMTSEGLPVGMHVIGRQYHDEEILQLSRTWEEMNPWTYEKAFNRM